MIKFILPKSVKEELKIRVRKIHEKKIQNKQNKSLPTITDTRIWDAINDFFIELSNKDNTVPEYITHTISNIGFMPPDKFKDVFAKRGTSEFAYFDIIFMFLRNDASASFLLDQKITTSEELFRFIHTETKYAENFRKKTDSFISLYREHEKITQQIKDRIAEIDKSHEPIKAEKTKEQEKEEVEQNYFFTEFFNFNSIKKHFVKSTNVHVKNIISITNNNHLSSIRERKQTLSNKIMPLILLLFLLSAGGYVVWQCFFKKEQKDECYDYQKLASHKTIKKKTAGLRVLILPFRKGELELEIPFECQLRTRMRELVNELSYIDSKLVSLENIEIILGEDKNYSWEGEYWDEEMADSIAQDYRADYVLWGKCIREEENKTNVASFEIAGLWTGQKLNNNSIRRYEKPYEWSASIVPSSLKLIEKIVIRKDTTIRQDARINFITVRNIHSVKVVNQFKTIMAHYFIKDDHYKKAYNSISDLENLESLEIQLICSRKDTMLIPSFMEHIERTLKNKGFSAKNYEFIKIAQNFYYSLFITNYKSLNPSHLWGKYLSRANSLADSCLKYRSEYSSRYFSEIRYNSQPNISKEEIAGASNFLEQWYAVEIYYACKGDYGGLMEDNIDTSVKWYNKIFEFREFLPSGYRTNHTDINFISMLIHKGYYFKAEEYIFRLLGDLQFKKTNEALTPAIRIVYGLNVIENNSNMLEKFEIKNSMTKQQHLIMLWLFFMKIRALEYVINYQDSPIAGGLGSEIENILHRRPIISTILFWACNPKNSSDILEKAGNGYINFKDFRLTLIYLSFASQSYLAKQYWERLRIQESKRIKFLRLNKISMNYYSDTLASILDKNGI